jgi:hypothetical protein
VSSGPTPAVHMYACQPELHVEDVYHRGTTLRAAPRSEGSGVQRHVAAISEGLAFSVAAGIIRLRTIVELLR